MGVYCDWVYNTSSGCTGIVGIYSDWVCNAKCIVGTTHMLKTKPVVLWVHNASYIVGVSGNHDNSDTRVGLRNIAAPFLHCSRKQSIYSTVRYTSLYAFGIGNTSRISQHNILSDGPLHAQILPEWAIIGPALEH